MKTSQCVWNVLEICPFKRICDTSVYMCVNCKNKVSSYSFDGQYLIQAGDEYWEEMRDYWRKHFMTKVVLGIDD